MAHRDMDLEFPEPNTDRPMAGERGPWQGWGDWMDDDEVEAWIERAERSHP